MSGPPKKPPPGFPPKNRGPKGLPPKPYRKPKIPYVGPSSPPPKPYTRPISPKKGVRPRKPVNIRKYRKKNKKIKIDHLRKVKNFRIDKHALRNILDVDQESIDKQLDNKKFAYLEKSVPKLEALAFEKTLMNFSRRYKTSKRDAIRDVKIEFNGKPMLENAVLMYLKYKDKKVPEYPEGSMWFNAMVGAIKYEKRLGALDTYNIGNQHIFSLGRRMGRTEFSILISYVSAKLNYETIRYGFDNLIQYPLEPIRNFHHGIDGRIKTETGFERLAEDTVKNYFHPLGFVAAIFYNLLYRKMYYELKDFISNHRAHVDLFYDQKEKVEHFSEHSPNELSDMVIKPFFITLVDAARDHMKNLNSKDLKGVMLVYDTVVGDSLYFGTHVYAETMEEYGEEIDKSLFMDFLHEFDEKNQDVHNKNKFKVFMQNMYDNVVKNLGDVTTPSEDTYDNILLVRALAIMNFQMSPTPQEFFDLDDDDTIEEEEVDYFHYIIENLQRLAQDVGEDGDESDLYHLNFVVSRLSEENGED